jgi:hypothetical protein
LRIFYKKFSKGRFERTFTFWEKITKCQKLATKKNVEWEEPMGRKHIITRVKYRGKTDIGMYNTGQKLVMPLLLKRFQIYHLKHF